MLSPHAGRYGPGKNSVFGHFSRNDVFPKTLLKRLIHVVYLYEQSVGETHLSAKSSFNNPSLKRINVGKNS